MNILQLVPKLNVGGVEKGTIEVARYLTLKGHKAVVVSGGGRLERDLAAVGARHYKLPVGRKNPFVMIYCYRALKRIIKQENIDIVHARSRIPAITGYFAARAQQKTFITTAHGQYRKHLISRVMGWGKTVIVANDTMARYMKDNFKVPLAKMTVIPRGVDLKKFSFVPLAEKDADTFRIGMISRFTPLKGHLDFLEAASFVARRMPDIEVILMGDKASGKEEYLKKIELTMRRLLIDKLVKFVDSDNDVAEVLGGLDVLVSANREQEAFGRSVIEAQARGVPVVATRVGGVVENIRDSETGLLCEPVDPSDMAGKILQYVRDPEKAQVIAEKARKYVEENYSLDKTMAMTLDTYTKVLDSKNILIIKVSSLGDIILSTPSIKAIRKKFPRAHIKVLVDVKFREIFDNCPYIDEVITCDFKGRDKGFGLLRLMRRLQVEDIDISIDLQNNRKSHILSFLSMIPARYGYDNGKWSVLLNRKIGLPSKAVGPVQHQSYVLGLLGITGIDPHLELWPDDKNDKWADDFLKESWLIKEQKLVAISLSASRRWRTKNWGIQSMVQLAERLESEKGVRIVLIGAQEDKAYAEEFVKKSRVKPINAVGKTNALQLISLINRCDALVSGDSAPIHVAAALKVPFVALFGPTDPERHLPPSERFRVLYKGGKCSPCYKPVCMKQVRCMTSIKPEEVFEAVVELLDNC